MQEQGVMNRLEKVAKHLELAELKKNSLEESILTLLEQCKDFEDQMDSTHKDINVRFRELIFREKKLNSEKETLELTRELIEKKLKEVGDREKEFALFCKEKVRALELREEELVSIREVYVKEVDEKLSEQEKRVQALLTSLKSEKVLMEGVKNFVEKKFKEIEPVEKSLQDKRGEIETRTRELKQEEGKIKERERKVELKEEELNVWKARHDETVLKENQLRLTLEDLEFQEKNNDFIRKLNEKRMKELDLKEELEKKGKEVLEKGLKELEWKRKEFAERIEEFELRKKELQESFNEFHSKNNNFLSDKKLLEEASITLQEKEKKFEDRSKQLELKEKQLQESLKEFHLKQKESLLKTGLLKKESKDLESKWKEFECRIQEFNGRVKLFEESLEEIHVKEKQFQLAKELLEKESKHLESRRKELEESSKKFELREKELELKEKHFQLEKELPEKDSKHLQSRRKELEERSKKFEPSEKELKPKEKHFQLEKELTQKESNHLESKRKELEESSKKLELRDKELEPKEKQLYGLPHAQSKTEQILGAVSQRLSCNSTDLNITSVVMMDGKNLQIFLNEHERDHCSMADEVFKSLQLCKDPAKLVLTAMEGFFPPHLTKGNREFSGDVVRSSCMLLLRQLIRTSPQIQPCVRDEALKLAKEWKTKMVTESLLEVFGFLCLIASYDVASAFDPEDIMRCLEFAAQHQSQLEPELCCRLGLKEKIPNLIENLLQSNQSLVAVNFIYGFELLDRFPPVPILKNYLQHIKTCSIRLLRKRGNKENVQNEYVNVRVAAIRSVIRCIIGHKLESQLPPKDLENTIKQLLTRKGDRNLAGPSNGREAQGQKKVKAKQISSTAAPSHPTHRLAGDLSNTFGVPSHPMVVIIASMDGKNLLSFLSSHVVECELLHNEVSSALQISDRSPRLVLDAVESLYYSHQTENETRSCIFLLEQLMGFSPNIIPDVKDAAQKIAFEWQAKLRANNGNSLLLLMFLLLLSAYRLDHTLHRKELLDLYQRVEKQKPSPALIHALGISEDISIETQKATSRSLPVKNLTESSSMVPELHVESVCAYMDLEGKKGVSVCSEVPSFINHSSDPADLILDALRNCYGSNFSKSKNHQLVFKSFCHLLEQLMSVSPEIGPKVQGCACSFALDWKAKSTGPCSWEALGFLQLVATYQLSSVFSSDELFGLLEVVWQPKEAGELIRLLGLVDKIPGFISHLIKKKKHLLAFAHVYDFKLFKSFPPVAILKRHVRYSKMVANRIRKKGRHTHEAQLVSEISALEAVIKLISKHGLQSKYSPDELQSTIEQLESRRANLNTSKQKVNANVCAPEVKRQHVETEKRPASDCPSGSQAHLQPASKIPRLVSPSQFISDRQYSICRDV